MQTITRWEDIPLYRIGRRIFRGKPNSMSFIGWVRNREGKCYEMILSREYTKMESVTFDNTYIHRIRLKNELYELNESIKNTINDIRYDKKTIQMLKKLIVNKTTKTTNKQIETIIEKGEKAKGIAWTIINRIESSGRTYKTDGEKIHRGFDRKKASERLVGMIKRERDGEVYYYDSMGVVRLNIKRRANGMCDFKYISLLTNENVIHKRTYVFEKYHFLRTKGDVNSILSKIKENDLPFKYDKVKKLRSERYLINAMLEELNREERKLNGRM